ncbi:hypothetical protein Leryth_015826 [Lithospermum erythrorhizon]|nr:hypothetical protein Leryth_015826 [Lithospermum erythrorhizon]
MSGFKKTSSCNSLSSTALKELNHNRSSSEGENGQRNIAPLGTHIHQNRVINSSKKENMASYKKVEMSQNDKENAVPENAKRYRNDKENAALGNVGRVLKPSSLQLCIQKNEPDSKIGAKMFEPADSENKNSGNIWDYSDSEAAPASSWSTLPNRTLLYRPLPLDIGRCTCVIVKESSPDGLDGGTLYSLYTHEGEGRQNRKLAVAYHKRPGGRSEFVVAQSKKGILYNGDDSLIGKVTSNLIGSKYQIFDQESCRTYSTNKSKLLALVRFTPTVATLAGSYRSMKAWIPKHQSMQLKSTAQIQHINGLPDDWEEKVDRVHQLFSKVPQYNKVLHFDIFLHNISLTHEMDVPRHY